MYGIVNKSIEELITSQFGIEVWKEVKKKSGVTIDYFLSNEAYDDSITYQLATAASEILKITVGEVLIVFGEWWILDTCNKKYRGMMASAGDTLGMFLLNLPRFHDRTQLMYPKLTPPEFRVEQIEKNRMHVSYISKRPGLQEFVRGLLQGLGKLFQESTAIQLIKSREVGDEYEIFEVSW